MKVVAHFKPVLVSNGVEVEDIENEWDMLKADLYQR